MKTRLNGTFASCPYRNKLFPYLLPKFSLSGDLAHRAIKARNLASNSVLAEEFVGSLDAHAS